MSNVSVTVEEFLSSPIDANTHGLATAAASLERLLCKEPVWY